MVPGNPPLKGRIVEAPPNIDMVSSYGLENHEGNITAWLGLERCDKEIDLDLSLHRGKIVTIKDYTIENSSVGSRIPLVLVRQIAEGEG